MKALLESPWLSQLGWVIVHSLWQGALLWALLALAFALGRKRLSSATKHRLAWLTLTALALAPVATMIWLQSHKDSSDAAVATQVMATPATAAAAPAPAVATASPVIPSQGGDAAAPTATAIPSRPSDSFASPSAPVSWVKQIPVFLAFAWMIGLVFLILRLLVGWCWVKRLRHTGSAPDAAWQARFLEWSSRASLRSVHVLISPTLGVPLVIGWLRPLICFPASLLSRLSMAEVEALMLHELAHLKRRDPLLQFWVTVVETLLFHNPAAHALARIARQTGELACDDLVLQWQGDGRTYARALAAAEEWRGTQFALAATGAGSLKHRIQRILGMGEHGRLSSLPERFGITSVAGIALYFIVCGLAVPPIARALTPEERVSVINQERQALQVTSEDTKPREFNATGTVRMADGSKPAEGFTIMSWSQGYSAFYGGVVPGENTPVEGRGDRMFVGAWIPGYAPSITPVITRDPKRDRSTFELVVNRGFPASVKFVDKAERPIPDAIIKCSVNLAPDCDYYYQGKLGTDATGACTPGNATAEQSFMIEVRAFGYQWQRFLDVRFKEGNPITFTLLEAAPVAGNIVDSRTQKPVAGASAVCMQRQVENGPSHHFGYSLAPKMNASPSNQEGRLKLDICHPDDNYQVVVEAPGYARKLVELSAQSGDFRVALEPELVISGIVEDPGKKLHRRSGKVSLELESRIGEHGYQVLDTEEFEVDAQDRIPFTFHHLPPGKTSLQMGYGRQWEADLQSSLGELVFRVEGNSLKCISGPDTLVKPAPVPTRAVEVVFEMPQDSAPFSGDVALSVSGKPLAYHKVTNNRCTVDVPIGAYLQVHDFRVTGYRFDNKRVKVEAGEGPIRMDLRMEAAGAISGDLRLPPGYQPGHNKPYLVLMKRDPRDGSWNLQHDNERELVRVLDDGSRFFISPVALNASYRIIAQHGPSFVETPEFQLDDSQPLLRQDIIFPNGERVQGTILQPDGTPMEGGMVFLIYKEVNYRHSGMNYFVKPDGTFELPAMNFTITGQYFLSVPATRGIAPLIARLDGSSLNVRLQRQAGHTVEGELVDPSGAPVSGVKLRFVHTEIVTQSSFIDVGDSITSDASDASGHFRISTFPPGEYRAYLDDWKYDWAGVGANTLDYPGRLVQVPASTGTVYKFQIKKR
ncbi:MAG: M56 family metallopeptidase [Roseimicrobium sp.]